MYRIDDATAATSLPAPETAGTEGYFTEGNPATGTPATKVRGSWLNMIQEELCAILAAAGIARSKTTYNQVNLALQKLYSPVIGSGRNIAMSVSAASASATLTADEIVIGAALGGQKYMLSSFNKTINLATTGAGGMDTGAAPVSGYVALYAIYNPTTGASALLATNATSSLASNIYGGANMPSGYTASALVSVWPTNGSGQFVPGVQRDRKFLQSSVQVLNTTTAQSQTALSIASAVPLNAKYFSGYTGLLSTSTVGMSINLWSASSGGFITHPFDAYVLANVATITPFENGVVTSQNIGYSTTSGGGAVTFNIFVTGYTI
ncbi:hypothetical protein P5W99_24360 [Paraburkholderia sp. A3BS-1L]|uniref:hypothetical protein n=1 Tax=Paraburkholderia sp. A3BS-1L TaxID=3028375 RepID=UPI003DAA3A36